MWYDRRTKSLQCEQHMFIWLQRLPLQLMWGLPLQEHHRHLQLMLEPRVIHHPCCGHRCDRVRLHFGSVDDSKPRKKQASSGVLAPEKSNQLHYIHVNNIRDLWCILDGRRSRIKWGERVPNSGACPNQSSIFTSIQSVGNCAMHAIQWTVSFITRCLPIQYAFRRHFTPRELRPFKWRREKDQKLTLSLVLSIHSCFYPCSG